MRRGASWLARASGRCKTRVSPNPPVVLMIPDRLFYPLAALVIAGLIGLAMVYPQGQGAPSPAALKPGPVGAAMKAVGLK